MQQFNGTLNGPLIGGRGSQPAAGSGANAGISLISGASGGVPFDAVLKGTGPATLPQVAGEGPRSRTGSLLPPAGTSLPGAPGEQGEAGGLADELVGYFEAGEGALVLAAETGSAADSIPLQLPAGPALAPDTVAPDTNKARRDAPVSDLVVTGTGKNLLNARPADGPAPQQGSIGAPGPLSGKSLSDERLPSMSLDRPLMPAKPDAGVSLLQAQGRETAETRSAQITADITGTGRGRSDLPAPEILPSGRALNGSDPRLTAGVRDGSTTAGTLPQGERAILPGSGSNEAGRFAIETGNPAGTEWPGARRSATAAPEQSRLMADRGLAGLRTASDQTAANERFAATPVASGDGPDSAMPLFEAGAARNVPGSLPTSTGGAAFSLSPAGTVAPVGGGAAPTGQVPASFTIDASVLDPAWQNAVNERMVWMAGRNLQSAELRLNPAELGPIQVQLSVDEKAVSLSISAAHPLTREALESALPRLREMLSENGMDLAGANVSDGAVDDRSSGGFESDGEAAGESTDLTGQASSGPDDPNARDTMRRSAPDSRVDLFA